jgi:hypothetical protein
MSSNFTGTVSTVSSNTFSGIASGGSCPVHGGYSCYCRSNLSTQPTCPACGQLISNYSSFHLCTGTNITTAPNTGTWNTIKISNWLNNVLLKDIKEITTDEVLEYVWTDQFDLKLPQKFSDCFLKVGYTWSPLYPIIFSGFMNDEKEISFHIVTSITDKIFEGDKVVLKGITTVKIEDNLTLIQLSQRTTKYFKDNDTSN